MFDVDLREQKDLFTSQPKNQEEASELVSVGINSAPKLTPPVSNVAEEVETSMSLVMNAPHDDISYRCIPI